MLTTAVQDIFVHCPFTESPLFELPVYSCKLIGTTAIAGLHDRVTTGVLSVLPIVL